MDFPLRVYHREHGPRVVHDLETLLQLAVTHGLGWHSDPVAAARGEHLVIAALECAGVPAVIAEVVVPVAAEVAADVFAQKHPHADPGALPPAAAVIEVLAPTSLLEMSDAELEAATKPEHNA